MTTVNQKIQNDLILHQALLLNLALKQKRQFRKILQENNILIYNEIISAYAEFTRTVSKTENERYEKLARRLAKVRLKAVVEFRKTYDSELKRMMKLEISYIDKSLHDITNLDFETVKPDNTNDFLKYGSYSGKTPDQHFNTIVANEVNTLLSIVRVAVSDNTSSNQLGKTVKQKLNIINGHADSIVQTITLGLANDARRKFFTSNTIILPFEVFVAVLDSVTTERCRDENNKHIIYIIGTAPRPPLHYNCRSAVVPFLNPLAFIGDRDEIVMSNGTIMKRNNFIAYIGKAPEPITFVNWLKLQSPENQNKILGADRAKAYRAGELQFTEYDSEGGTPMDLQQVFGVWGIKAV